MKGSITQGIGVLGLPKHVVERLHHAIHANYNPWHICSRSCDLLVWDVICSWPMLFTYRHMGVISLKKVQRAIFEFCGIQLPLLVVSIPKLQSIKSERFYRQTEIYGKEGIT